MLGPEVLRGLHKAFGSALKTLRIESTWDGAYWTLAAGFWEVLPDVLPQLQELVLCEVSPQSFGASLAMSVMCSKMWRAGRSFCIVFKRPLRREEMQEGVAALREFQPLVSMRVE